MSETFHAEIWSPAVDQYGRQCWHNGKGQVTYTPPGNCPLTWPWQLQQHFPFTIAVVGEKVKPSAWKVYTDDDTGDKYYHNVETGETTWDKPEGFDEKKNEGKPSPPPKKDKGEKEDKKACKPDKYGSHRKGWI